MSVKTKTIFLNTVLVAGLALGSTTVFAGSDIVPGTISPCQQLKLAADVNNDADSADGSLVREDGTYDHAGVCVDVPVTLNKVKAVFNLDNVVVDGSGASVGLKHIIMLAGVLKRGIANGDLTSDDISIVGLFHGEAMTVGKWAFKTAPAQILNQINIIDGLAHPTDGSPAINIQLEACGTTIKGMQLNGNAKLPNGLPLDEKAMNPKVLVNQGAIARLIDLEQHKYVYVQED